jgi:DNA-binding beta-propeller fold protein YncE
LYVADYGQSTWNGVKGHTVTPVSLPAGRLSAAIRVGQQPGQMVPMANGELYVLLDADGNSVIPVSAATGKAGPAMTFPGGAGYLLASPDRRTLYVIAGGYGSGQAIVPVDVATGHRGQPVKLAAGSVAGVVASTDGTTLYVAYDDASDQQRGEIVPVSLRTGLAAQPIRLGGSPIGLALSPDGKSLYVASSIGNLPGLPLGPQDLFVVGIASRRVVRSVTLRNPPQAIAVAPSGRTIYIQNQDTTITPVSTTTWAAGATIHTSGIFKGQGASLPGGYTSSLVIAQDGRTMYASNGAGVAVIPLAG